MKHIKYYLFLVLFACSVTSEAQDDLAICVDWKGGQRFDFIAENFTDLISFQLSIKWDSSYGRIVKFDNFGLDDLNDAGFVHEPFHPNGTAVMNWLDQSLDGQTLEDGTVLFSMFLDHKNAGLVLPRVDDEPLTFEVIYQDETVSEQINISTQCISQNLALLTGSVSYDLTDDCVVNNGDLPLSEAMVRISSGPDDIQYRVTNQYGEYWAWLPVGEYSISHFNPDSPFVACVNSQDISITTISDTARVDFAIAKQESCPLLSISAAAPALIHCDRNRVYFEYCNKGNQSIDTARAVLTLDELLFNVSSDLPFTDLGSNRYLFELPRIDSFDCNQFFIETDVSCDAKIGESHCIKAEISPISVCLEPNALWNKASLEVDAICGNATLWLIVRNVGSGDMDEFSSVLIVKNNEETTQHFVQLLAGEEESFPVIPGEDTYRIIVDQVPFHPGNSHPSLGVEGCATNGNSEFLLGYLTQFHEEDEDYHKEILCLENTESQEFPIKSAQPIGIGELHLIPPARSLTYTLAVQNDKADTARRIIIVDHLSEYLNPLTIRNIVSSHPNNLVLEYDGERNLRFVFDGIDLPSSQEDEQGSRLFVSFNIDQVDGTRDELIVNMASVFFDDDESVELNETFHEVSEQYLDITNGTISEESKTYIDLFPNPAGGGQEINIPKDKEITAVRIFQNNGNLRSELAIENNLLTLPDLSPGLYFIELRNKKGELYFSRVFIQ